jgi:hypothetical protein
MTVRLTSNHLVTVVHYFVFVFLPVMCCILYELYFRVLLYLCRDEVNGMAIREMHGSKIQFIFLCSYTILGKGPLMPLSFFIQTHDNYSALKTFDWAIVCLKSNRY